MPPTNAIKVDDPALDEAFPLLKGTWKPDDVAPGWVISAPWSVQRVGDRWYVHIKQGCVEVYTFDTDLKATRDATLARAVEACCMYAGDTYDGITAAYATIERLRDEQKAINNLLESFRGMKAGFAGVPAQEDLAFENSAENACDICHARPRKKQCMCRCVPG